MIPIPAILTSLFSIGSDWLEGRRKLKAVKLDSEVKLAQAKADAMIKLMAEKQSADIAWENLSIQNNGWRDEWFTILLSIPMVLCFIPGGAVYVGQGFDALNESTPDWYQWAFLVAVASSFGYKKIADLMSLRKGV